MAAVDPDHALRVAAQEQVRRLQQLYDDVVPRAALLEGFRFGGERISFGSFQKGIHRARQQRGPAALTLVTSPNSPYDDVVDEEAGAIVYAYREGALTQADNRALDAAFELQAPLIYFKGIDRGQYAVVQPVFVTDRDRETRVVLLEPGLPVADLTTEGLVSPRPVRLVALREVKVRLAQHQFRRDVMHAYRQRCAVCALKRIELIQAAHILEFASEGTNEVTNGVALCAIHHLAYDRNLLGIDPTGVVHIARALRDEKDGPMLREGIQSFHGMGIKLPTTPTQRPDPERLAQRFERFAREDAA
ncbi:MAG: HNH endonuclease [Thermoleophilaceae bacterium]